MTAARALRRLLAAYARDCRGAAAHELALLGVPFVILLLSVMQMGVYFMTQMSLNAGTVQAAEALHAVFATGATPDTASFTSSMKSTIVSGAGGGINSNGVSVEVQPLSNLGSSYVAISDGTASYGSAWTPLVLRASYSFTPFIPLVGSTWTVKSSAIVRRQGQ